MKKTDTENITVMIDRTLQDLEALSFESRVHEAPCDVSPHKAATMLDADDRIGQAAGIQAYIERAKYCDNDPVAVVEALEALLPAEARESNEAANRVLTTALVEDTEIVLQHLDTVSFLANCGTASGQDAARALSEAVRWDPDIPLAIEGLIELTCHRNIQVARVASKRLAEALIVQEAGLRESRHSQLPVDINDSQPQARRLLAEAIAQLAINESEARKVVKRSLSDTEIRTVRITAANVLASTHISVRDDSGLRLFPEFPKLGPWSGGPAYHISLEALAATFRAYPRDDDRIRDLDEALRRNSSPMIATKGLASLLGKGILSSTKVEGAVHTPAFEHNDPEIRQFAARQAYWQWQSRYYNGHHMPYVESVCDLLRDPALKVRRAAAKTLEQFVMIRQEKITKKIRRNTTGWTQYLSLLMEPDDELRGYLIEIFTQMILDEPAEVILLKPLLRSDDKIHNRTALEVAASVAKTDTGPIISIWDELLPRLEEENQDIVAQFQALITEVLMEGATDAAHLQAFVEEDSPKEGS